MHVNHFSLQSLVCLASANGFTHTNHVEYSFPYRDGGSYPALGVLFQKSNRAMNLSTPSILAAVREYMNQEQKRARVVASQFDSFDGVLVWGAGDNFYRSVGNGGPLSQITRMVVLDSQPQVIRIGESEFKTERPAEGIRLHPWPVIITVSEHQRALIDQVKQIDPSRPVFCL
jgi:hypothetical protein